MSSHKILIIDSNPDLRALLSDCVQRINCTPVEAESGAQAQALIAEQPQLGLILTEVGYSDGSALPVLQAVRAIPSMIGLKVILVSREVRARAIAPLLQLGVHDF